MVMSKLPATLKQQMKKVMPFIGYVRDEVRALGPSALDRTPKFDQEEVLRDNQEFILSQLGLERMDFGDVSSPAAGHERMASESLPDKPGFVLMAE